ncbi:hypothetical protein ILUMI_22089 [Ignelater luminosus]|uniref:Reverse transcriptase domain-containing protein n=1 Tax=Ignelater luminosus TaxID=2038154 RepID=A0A8K0G384_IGNLU|nr:hypothetical protein ILUMI_22089 [Ignelater luminosus]
MDIANWRIESTAGSKYQEKHPSPNVQKAINFFPSNSASAIDDLLPQHLKEMTSKLSSDAGKDSSLRALNKNDGGLCPIAVGNVFRRLTAKLACYKVRNYVRLYQIDFATQRGCEAAIHTVRILVILSLVGVQRGDPAGPMTFSLTIQPIIDELKSDLIMFYLDDGILSDDREVVLSDFMNLVDRSKEIGFQVNPSKCEFYFCSGDVDTNIFTRCEDVATEKFKPLETMINCLTGLPLRVAYFLVKNCFALPKLTYLLRPSPAWKLPEWCSDLDKAVEKRSGVDFEHQTGLRSMDPSILSNKIRKIRNPKGSGRFSRHNELNGILKRSLSLMNMPCSLECGELVRDDGKRPDGMTHVPWSRGQHLVWDVTYTDTLADSHVEHSAVESGYATKAAAKRKLSINKRKYPYGTGKGIYQRQ